ncbi:STAS/SEC14 domain-containing protein [Sphingosinicella terrae]|uniref:STAS/SEC14 domain-containing protein n=1 Tax=Sphingosinicella terrae TaxID=2172047 RepID=UPI000E0D077E|nr:STAS/SEC14 domain-containing protein [Sphingosinicella terrae]
MLEYLPANEDVIALRCGGTLQRAELEGFMDRLEASLAAHDRTHFYAEIVDFSGVETDGLGDLMKRSAVYFQNLRRIGRVGIVADQSWIRWATKLEGALLPHVSYETFDSSERDLALAWVQGERAHPHGAAIRIIDTDRPDVLAFAMDGHVDRAEMDAVTAHFLSAIEGKTKIRMLGRIGDIGGFEMSGLFTGDYFAMKRTFLERMERYAIIGGPAWLRTTLNALAPLFKVEIRHFDTQEEDAAWSWLGARPTGERTLVD